jgi:hypothetical protein
LQAANYIRYGVDVIEIGLAILIKVYIIGKKSQPAVDSRRTVLTQTWNGNKLTDIRATPPGSAPVGISSEDSSTQGGISTVETAVGVSKDLCTYQAPHRCTY